MDFKPPSGPPPNYNGPQLSSNNPYLNAGRQETSGQAASARDYQPPPGPPPSQKKEEAYQPPPGPPLSKEPAPPPYDPWLAVPDNALLPPPPSFMEDYSPANNASHSEALRARAWCKHNPLWAPREWSTEALEQIDAHQFSLSAQPSARAITISQSGPGHTTVKSTKRQGDTTILSSLPLYTPRFQPAAGKQRTIYYQVHMKHIAGPDTTVAIGFLAPSYPPDRLPGWHRGSLAVHNDDGRRYVNDDDGGMDFVQPFGAGERVGIGMTFTGLEYGPAKVKVFFTRNGHEEGSWDLHESRDAKARDGGVVGLDGTTDLYAAIGVCGSAELEVNWAV